MKKIMIACLGCMAIIFLLVIVRKTAFENEPKEYRSEVAAEDCLLCGLPNDFRNTEALGLIIVQDNHWRFSNIGMVQYCREDPWAFDECSYERIRDDALTPEQLAHKNTPFDINGVLKVHSEPFTSTRCFYRTEGKDGVSCTLNMVTENGLITGAFTISHCNGADADYLCSVLCQECFDKVYPITRHGNFFLADCLTGAVYPLCDAEERSFEIREYQFKIQLQDWRYLVFYATYSTSESKQNISE